MELTIPVKVKLESTILDICDSRPTCEDCPFWYRHKGCYFRDKTPKEWGKLRLIFHESN